MASRARTIRTVAGREEFLEIGCALLHSLMPLAKSIRRLGLTLSNLSEGGEGGGEGGDGPWPAPELPL